MIKKQRITELAQRLIRSRSENPPGEEYNTAMLVKEAMEKIGLDVSVYEFEKRRPNIIGTLKGDGTLDETIILSVHTDVVPTGSGWSFDPYSAELRDGKILGRGASDCKGHIAVCLEAARSIIEDKKSLRGNLIIAATVDEENGDEKGLLPLLEKGILKATSALSVDVAEFEIVTAQKGVLHIAITVKGKKAHGAYPHKGINAIEIGAKIITGLKEHRFKYIPHPLFEGPTINLGTISGGDKVNMVADSCSFEIDLRYLPGMDKNEIMDAVENIIKKYAKDYTFRINTHLAPYEIKSDHKLISQLKEAFKRKGIDAKIKGSAGATVIADFEKYGIPAIATGFGIEDCAHAVDEYAVVDDLVKGAEIIEEFVLLSLR